MKTYRQISTVDRRKLKRRVNLTKKSSVVTIFQRYLELNRLRERLSEAEAPRKVR